MKYVYLLWDYGEYGPEDMRATLDSSMLPRMVDAHYANMPGLLDRLSELLRKDPEHLATGGPARDGETRGVYALTDGWGGLCLQVVLLEER